MKPSSKRLPTSTSKFLVGEGLIPLLQPLQVVHTLTILFNKMGGGEHLSNMKNKACKDYSKALNSNYCFSKGCNLSWDLRGIYRPQEDSNLGSKIWILFGSRCWRCHRRALGCWAVPPPGSRVLGGATAKSGGASLLVGLQNWPKPVRTRAQLAPTWFIGLTPNLNPK